MEWLVDPPETTRTKLDKTEWDLARFGQQQMCWLMLWQQSWQKCWRCWQYWQCWQCWQWRKCWQCWKFWQYVQCWWLLITSVKSLSKLEKKLLSDWLTPSLIWIQEMLAYLKMTNFRPYLLKFSLKQSYLKRSQRELQKNKHQVWNDVYWPWSFLF